MQHHHDSPGQQPDFLLLLKQLQEQHRSSQSHAAQQKASGEGAPANGTKKRNNSDGYRERWVKRVPRKRADTWVSDVCSACECEGGHLLTCMGPCLRAFHPGCIGEAPVAPEDRGSWFCPECDSGIMRCFACGKHSVGFEDPFVKKCSLGACGRFYHTKCVLALPRTHSVNAGRHFRCPQHYCTVCERSGDGVDMVKCLRCPASFHSGCLPDGAIRLRSSAKAIVCNVCAAKPPPPYVRPPQPTAARMASVLQEARKEGMQPPPSKKLKGTHASTAGGHVAVHGGLVFMQALQRISEAAAMAGANGHDADCSNGPSSELYAAPRGDDAATGAGLLSNGHGSSGFGFMNAQLSDAAAAVANGTGCINGHGDAVPVLHQNGHTSEDGATPMDTTHYHYSSTDATSAAATTSGDSGTPRHFAAAGATANGTARAPPGGSPLHHGGSNSPRHGSPAGRGSGASTAAGSELPEAALASGPAAEASHASALLPFLSHDMGRTSSGNSLPPRSKKPRPPAGLGVAAAVGAAAERSGQGPASRCDAANTALAAAAAGAAGMGPATAERCEQQTAGHDGEPGSTALQDAGGPGPGVQHSSGSFLGTSSASLALSLLRSLQQQRKQEQQHQDDDQKGEVRDQLGRVQHAHHWAAGQEQGDDVHVADAEHDNLLTGLRQPHDEEQEHQQQQQLQQTQGQPRGMEASPGQQELLQQLFAILQGRAGTGGSSSVGKVPEGNGVPQPGKQSAPMDVDLPTGAPRGTLLTCTQGQPAARRLLHKAASAAAACGTGSAAGSAVQQRRPQKQEAGQANAGAAQQPGSSMAELCGAVPAALSLQGIPTPVLEHALRRLTGDQIMSVLLHCGALGSDAVVAGDDVEAAEKLRALGPASCELLQLELVRMGQC